jgi:hypothetical protein
MSRPAVVSSLNHRTAIRIGRNADRFSIARLSETPRRGTGSVNGLRASGALILFLLDKTINLLQRRYILLRGKVQKSSLWR